MSKEEQKWTTELIRQVPVPALLLIASFFFFVYVDFWPGLLLLICSIIFSTILFKNEQHRHDILILEKRAEQYHKIALKSTRNSQKAMAETTQILNKGIEERYTPIEKSSTEIE